MQDYEKLGLFYLGRPYDTEARALRDGLVLYDSRDLVTHAVCVGMTGSGKTGLCIALLEEAALDGVPVIAIDPKGDLGNLLLTFPQMRAADLKPWVDADEATRSGVSVDEYARDQAERWKTGLAEWGQPLDRIQRLRGAAEFSIYTPGSSAGLPVSILESFAAPPPSIRDDGELLGERVDTAATSLLTLVGSDPDPRSQEHVLLATIFSTAWKAGADMDLAGLIQQIQKPPVTKVGVLDLESFYPAADRFKLAMRLNQLLAAPGFDAWRQGETLDVDRLLFTAEGRPRVSIFSIGHLDDVERMFFVSLLLMNQVLGWMRGQAGTTSLRALLYMDEIFGFFPPVANPPSKTPLLTLLKQGRAFGLGVVLATQNPVDLDYKGLSNAGTWFLGRLQTDQDKARVLDGLEGIAATAGGFERPEIERTLAALEKRVFLMHDVHQPAPQVFQTRWAMSYLRGPLTREDIKRLMADQKAARLAAAATAAEVPATDPAVASSPSSSDRPVASPASVTNAATRPVMPVDVPAYFMTTRSTAPPGAQLVYEPALFGAARLHFVDSKRALDFSREASFVATFADGPVPLNWDSATEVGVPPADLSSEPEGVASYAEPPSVASRAKSYEKWVKEFSSWLYRSQKLSLLSSRAMAAVSAPDESERAFRIRLQGAAREQRDAQIDKIQKKYAAKHTTLTEQIRRAEQAVSRESSQVQQQTVQAAVSFGATVLGALLGRKGVSASTLGRATTAAKGMGRMNKESQDVDRAKQTVDAKKAQLSDLEAQIQAETDALGAALDPAVEALATVEVAPKKSDIGVQLVALVWLPFWQLPDGRRVNAWSAS